MASDGTDGYIYDEFAYPSFVHAVANPDLICAAGQFYGWQANDPVSASVLEIGCFDGLNLIAIAGERPGTRCVGFDLSASAIDRGRELAAACGLSNVELHHADLRTFPRSGEQFDYILCHGVLSWVPLDVRPSIFEVIAGRLAPGGVAYLGYDALPAAATKSAIVDFLVRHVSESAAVADQLQSVGKMLEILARNQDRRSRLKPQLDDLLSHLPNYSPSYFLHDWLVSAYAPLSVRDFALAGNASGLAFAGDVSLTDLFSADIDAEGQALLRESMDSLVNFTADLDVMRGSRMFRTDMLVRADAPPPRHQGPPAVTYAFTARREIGEDDEGKPTLVIGVPDRGRVTLMDTLDIAVANWIADRSPGEFSADEIAAGTGADRAGIEHFLRRFGIMGLLDLHSTPPNFTLTPGDRPVAGTIARAVATGGGTVADLRHRSVAVPDAVNRRILQLANGTRTRDEIVQALADGNQPPFGRSELDAAIAELAGLRLFSA